MGLRARRYDPTSRVQRLGLRTLCYDPTGRVNIDGRTVHGSRFEASRLGLLFLIMLSREIELTHFVR